ncbi:MAG: hypothetical protein CSA11_12170 [Chloroflexi bacterium]|nr:MAG: hypothetical protein CSA11_12170 [Chloroflexota bacterium]
MNEQRIETNESPQIMIAECVGNVMVKSWRQTAVSIQGAAFTTEQNGLMRITSQDDLFLAVPEQSSISLGIVSGDVVIKHIRGGITGDDLQGDVTLNNVDAVQIDRVGQTLSAADLNGTLNVQHIAGSVALQRISEVKLGTVKGNAMLAYTNGTVDLQMVAGNLSLKSINGDVAVATASRDVLLQNMGGHNNLPAVQGDVWLVGSLRAGEQTFVAEGTIFVYWPEEAPLRLFATAPQIDNLLPLDYENKNEAGKQVILTGHIEEGKTSLTLKSAQRIALKALGLEAPQFSPNEFVVPQEPAGELEQQVQTAVHAVLAESATLERLEERLVTAVTAALTDIKIPEPESTPTAPDPAAAVSKPPPELYIVESTESRTHILALLRDGLISIAQADLLLEALAS